MQTENYLFPTINRKSTRGVVKRNMNKNRNRKQSETNLDEEAEKRGRRGNQAETSMKKEKPAEQNPP